LLGDCRLNHVHRSKPDKSATDKEKTIRPFEVKHANGDVSGNLAFFVLFCLLLGMSRGEPVTGLLFGLLFGPLGLLVMLLDRSDLEKKTCLLCFEKINKEATVCKHCGRESPAPATKMDEVS
jgi:hypothetical protein